MKPLAIDLFCGLGGWAEGFLAEGYTVIGFDIERHDYGTGGYPGHLCLHDVTTLHGSQFKDARVIVASPPCQAYSYRAMPWKRAKALPPPDNTLFEACFRIQREACAAAGRYIPLVVENVRGAQKWVGRSRWHFGSYHLWGDIPALMPIANRSDKKTDCPPVPLGELYRATGKPNQCHITGTKVRGLDWSKHGTPGYKAEGFNVVAAQRFRQEQGSKGGGDWFGRDKNCSLPRSYSSRSDSRKAASAQIAKIPFPLANHVARVFA